MQRANALQSVPEEQVLLSQQDEEPTHILDEDEQEAWGRPVDVLILEDGSMLISDDYANAIYRVYYEG